MLQSFAKYLTDTLYRHCPLSPQKRPIFQYGFEITTSTLSSAFSILLISIFLRDVLSACLFLGIFFFLRLFAGGYHAPHIRPVLHTDKLGLSDGLSRVAGIYCLSVNNSRNSAYTFIRTHYFCLFTYPK